VELKEQLVGNVLVIDVIGRLDSSSAQSLQDRGASLIGGGTAAVLLDLEKVEYVSSAGFRALLILAKQAQQAKSRFVLCGLSPKVSRLFELGGFLDILPITKTREEGIAAAG
jgi:anti-anti-sigma factor